MTDLTFWIVFMSDIKVEDQSILNWRYDWVMEAAGPLDVLFVVDKLYEIKGVNSLSDTWVILPQDVGITLAATVLNNGWIKCEQDTSHILVWLYYQ